MRQKWIYQFGHYRSDGTGKRGRFLADSTLLRFSGNVRVIKSADHKPGARIEKYRKRIKRKIIAEDKHTVHMFANSRPEFGHT